MLEPLRKLHRFLSVGSDGTTDRAIGLGRYAVLVFLWVMPFAHNAAWKNVALAAMLVASIWLAGRRRLTVDAWSPIVWALGGLLGTLVFTATLGTEPMDSLDELRKHFLPGILLILLIPNLFQGERLSRVLLSVIAFSFMVRAGLTLYELAIYFPDLDTGRATGRFIKGFALDAGFYVPPLLGLFLLGGRWRWLAPMGGCAILIIMLLVQSRTPLVALGIAAIVMLVVLRRWRVILSGVALVIPLVGYLLLSHPEIASRFATLFEPNTYVHALDISHFSATEGLSARMPIWAGVAEITASRRMQGYGFGWKKLGRTAVEQGYVARWAALKGDAFAQEQAWYFALPTDKVNPHNLYLQVYFESGLIGLVAYLLTLLVLFWQAARLAWRRTGSARTIAALVLAYLADHVILGLGNGLWLGLGPSFALLALLEMIRRRECAV